MDIFSTAPLLFLIKFCPRTDENPVFKLSHACIRHTTNYKDHHIFIKSKENRLACQHAANAICL